MEFVCYGHKNIEATHKTTFELTQDTSVTPKGDCIIGTRSGFDAEALKALVQASPKLKITLKTASFEETVTADTNKEFEPGREAVIRKTDFSSPSTLGINADKAAADFSRKFIKAIKDQRAEIRVKIERYS